ncbi:MAG: hypothetical protein MI741_05470, partial [Rhodospirillales bacterium]|nr:hypothetical protein [Rhodospirillales bacterium]
MSATGGEISAQDIRHYRFIHPRLFGRSVDERVKTAAAGLAFTAFTLYTCWALGFFDLAMIG